MLDCQVNCRESDARVPFARAVQVVYRRYASLYVLAGVDSDENALAALELMHSYVEALDKFFGAVCELDIMFHLEKAHYILDEMVMNGARLSLPDDGDKTMRRSRRKDLAMTLRTTPVAAWSSACSETGCVVETNRAKILQPVQQLEVVKQ